MFNIDETKKAEIDSKKSKNEGLVYTLNDVDYQVPFMKDDADGVLTVAYNFDKNIYQNTVITFTNGTKMPITINEFTGFYTWFMNKRNSFFI